MDSTANDDGDGSLISISSCEDDDEENDEEEEDDDDNDIEGEGEEEEKDEEEDKKQKSDNEELYAKERNLNEATGKGLASHKQDTKKEIKNVSAPTSVSSPAKLAVASHATAEGENVKGHSDSDSDTDIDSDFCAEEFMQDLMQDSVKDKCKAISPATEPESGTRLLDSELIQASCKEKTFTSKSVKEEPGPKQNDVDDPSDGSVDDKFEKQLSRQHKYQKKKNSTGDVPEYQISKESIQDTENGSSQESTTQKQAQSVLEPIEQDTGTRSSARPSIEVQSRTHQSVAHEKSKLNHVVELEIGSSILSYPFSSEEASNPKERTTDPNNEEEKEHDILVSLHQTRKQKMNEDQEDCDVMLRLPEDPCDERSSHMQEAQFVFSGDENKTTYHGIANTAPLAATKYEKGNTDVTNKDELVECVVFLQPDGTFRLEMMHISVKAKEEAGQDQSPPQNIEGVKDPLNKNGQDNDQESIVQESTVQAPRITQDALQNDAKPPRTKKTAKRSHQSCAGATAKKQTLKKKARKKGPSKSKSNTAPSSPFRPKSGYWGVTQAVKKSAPSGFCYRAQVVKNDGSLLYLGTFDTAEEAARQYDAAALKETKVQEQQER